MSKMSVVCMIENAWSWCMSIVHEKEGEKKKTRKNCVDWQGKVRTNEKTNGQSAHVCSQDFKRVTQKAGVIIFILTRNFHQKRKKTKMKMLVAKSDRIKKLDVPDRVSEESESTWVVGELRVETPTLLSPRSKRAHRIYAVGGGGSRFSGDFSLCHPSACEVLLIFSQRTEDRRIVKEM